MNKNKFVEIPSLDWDTIDEVIARFKEYKKEYGGECTITVDTYVETEWNGGRTHIYQGINTKIPKEGYKDAV